MYYASIGLGQFMGPMLCIVLTEYTTYRQMFLVLSILPVVGLFATMQLKSTTCSERWIEGVEVSEKKSKSNGFVQENLKV